MDLVVKCQLLVTQTLIQLQRSLCRAVGASNSTESRICLVWRVPSLSWDWGPYSVTAIFRQIGVGENKLFSAHFFPTHDLP